MKNFKEGDKVSVMKQIGKDGIPQKTEGILERFSQTITVNGKPTAYVKFSDKKGDSYYYPIDELSEI